MTYGGGFDDASVAQTLRGTGFDASEDGTGRGTPLVPVPIQGAQRVRDTKQNGMGVGRPGDPMFTLDTRGDHAVAFDLAQLTHPENRSQPAPGKPAPTLGRTNDLAVAFYANQAGDSQLGMSEPGVPPVRCSQPIGLLAPGMKVRRLMPVECERLQGFPDGYTDIAGASDSARYEALGNTMAVVVMRRLGERIAVVDELVFPGAA